MQPNEYESEPYQQQTRDWDLSGFPTEPVTVHRTRAWAVALSAFLTGLAIIIAVGNPSVTRSITNQITQAPSVKNGVLASLTSLQWRFGAATGDHFRFWAGHLVANAAFLVLVFLLVWIVARARGGFWQAFFGTWACAVAAAMVATYAFSAVVDNNALDAPGTKLYFVFFGPYTGHATTLFGALMFGFVIAVVAGIVAVASRKGEVLVEAGPGGEAGQQGFFQQQQRQDTAGYPPLPGPVDAPSPWSHGDEGTNPTEALPRNEDERHTTQMPRTDQPGGESSESSGNSGSGDIWGNPRRDR